MILGSEKLKAEAEEAAAAVVSPMKISLVSRCYQTLSEPAAAAAEVS